MLRRVLKPAPTQWRNLLFPKPLQIYHRSRLRNNPRWYHQTCPLSRSMVPSTNPTHPCLQIRRKIGIWPSRALGRKKIPRYTTLSICSNKRLGKSCWSQHKLTGPNRLPQLREQNYPKPSIWAWSPWIPRKTLSLRFSRLDLSQTLKSTNRISNSTSISIETKTISEKQPTNLPTSGGIRMRSVVRLSQSKFNRFPWKQISNWTMPFLSRFEDRLRVVMLAGDRLLNFKMTRNFRRKISLWLVQQRLSKSQLSKPNTLRNWSQIRVAKFRPRNWINRSKKKSRNQTLEARTRAYIVFWIMILWTKGKILLTIKPCEVQKMWMNQGTMLPS